MPLTRDYTEADIDAMLHAMAREDGMDARNLWPAPPQVEWERSPIGQWLDRVDEEDDDSMRTAAEDGPLVVTGQGSYRREFTPVLSTGRRRASALRWFIFAVVAVTYPWWSKGF